MVLQGQQYRLIALGKPAGFSRERFLLCLRGAALICSLCTPARSWLYYLGVSSTCGSDQFIPCMFMVAGLRRVSSQCSLPYSFNSFCVITSFVVYDSILQRNTEGTLQSGGDLTDVIFQSYSVNVSNGPQGLLQ